MLLLVYVEAGVPTLGPRKHQGELIFDIT
uniref:Uncharacterized protein n=1 Tax=Anguilla anguilla TaxID=7936 RepID=A0A0E9TIN5_ANGAN